MLFVSVLPLCHDPVLFGQSHHAHEVHDTSQVSGVKPCREESLVTKESLFVLKVELVDLFGLLGAVQQAVNTHIIIL